MRDPFRHLLARLDRGAVLLTPDDRRDLDEGWDALAAAGWVAETVPATVAECPACDEPHDAAVFPFEIDGFPTRWFVRCPAAGSVPVAADSLRRWAVGIAAVGRAVTGVDAEERWPGAVWRAGPLAVGSVERVAWLVAGWRGRTGLTDAVPELRLPNAVVFVPCHLPPAGVWGSASPPLVVPLADVLRVTGTGVALHRPAVVTFLPPEPAAVVEPADTRPRLALPAGTRWEDVTLIVGNSEVELVLGVGRHRVGYDDLGLADGRSGGPLGAWEALKLLAREGCLGTGDRIDTKSGTLRNNVAKLREALQHWTGLADDPLPAGRRQPYRPRFKVRPGTFAPT